MSPGELQPVGSSRGIRVLLISDQPIIRAGLRLLIAAEPSITVVAEASDLAWPTRADYRKADIVLIDLDACDQRGVMALPEVLGWAGGVKALMLARVEDRQGYTLAIRMGAMGVVFKEKNSEVLVKAIQKVHAGEVWLERTIMADVLGDISRVRPGANAAMSAEIGTLTARERQVVLLISEGMKNKQVASRLFISETTVRHHLTSIFSKLDVRDRCGLVVYAFRNGLTALPLQPRSRSERIKQ